MLTLHRDNPLCIVILPLVLTIFGCEAPTQMATTHRDVVDLSSAVTAPAKLLPPNSSQHDWTLSVGDVTSAVLITGRPRVVCDYVRNNLVAGEKKGSLLNLDVPVMIGHALAMPPSHRLVEGGMIYHGE